MKDKLYILTGNTTDSVCTDLFIIEYDKVLNEITETIHIPYKTPSGYRNLIQSLLHSEGCHLVHISNLRNQKLYTILKSQYISNNASCYKDSCILAINRLVENVRDIKYPYTTSGEYVEGMLNKMIEFDLKIPLILPTRLQLIGYKLEFLERSKDKRIESLLNYIHHISNNVNHYYDSFNSYMDNYTYISDSNKDSCILAYTQYLNSISTIDNVLTIPSTSSAFITNIFTNIDLSLFGYRLQYICEAKWNITDKIDNLDKMLDKEIESIK